jgi:hypothetical protein
MVSVSHPRSAGLLRRSGVRGLQDPTAAIVPSTWHSERDNRGCRPQSRKYPKSSSCPLPPRIYPAGAGPMPSRRQLAPRRNDAPHLPDRNHPTSPGQTPSERQGILCARHGTPTAETRISMMYSLSTMYSLMPEDAKSARICHCRHPYAAHQHYRSGSECSLCSGCPRYRPAFGIIQLLAGCFNFRFNFRRRRRSL